MSTLTGFRKLVVLQGEIKQQVNSIAAKIRALNADYKVAQDEGQKADIEQCLALLQKHIEAEEKLLLEYEETTARIGIELVEKSALLSPLEELIIRKKHLDGLSWSELEAELLSNPEYDCFNVSRSSIFRANKSALNKQQGE